MLTETDLQMLRIAYEEAKLGFEAVSYTHLTLPTK